MRRPKALHAKARGQECPRHTGSRASLGMDSRGGGCPRRVRGDSLLSLCGEGQRQQCFLFYFMGFGAASGGTGAGAALY